jgi:hypothetical protein
MIPCVRIGRLVRFPESRLLEWIAAGGTRDGPDEALSFKESSRFA